MNTYMKLKFHLDRNIFKRGRYKGDAPAGSRWRHWVRVVKGNDDTMRVRMYGTDLLTAYPDGRVVIDTNGWSGRPTTKLRLNEAFGFMPFHVRLSSRKVFDISQPILSVAGKQVLFYDGIELDGQGTITSPLRPFERRQVDRALTKEIRDGMAECGFKEVFNVLWAASELGDGFFHASRLRNTVTNAYHSNEWSHVVSYFSWTSGNYYTGWRATKREPQAAWASLMQQLRKDCYEVVKTDVTVL